MAVPSAKSSFDGLAARATFCPAPMTMTASTNAMVRFRDIEVLLSRDWRSPALRQVRGNAAIGS
jgi:hypothetical protein